MGSGASGEVGSGVLGVGAGVGVGIGSGVSAGVGAGIMFGVHSCVGLSVSWDVALGQLVLYKVERLGFVVGHVKRHIFLWYGE